MGDEGFKSLTLESCIYYSNPKRGRTWMSSMCVPLRQDRGRNTAGTVRSIHSKLGLI